MRKIERFEDFEVWKKSVRLSIQIYKELKGCKDFGFRDQIQKADLSVVSNQRSAFSTKDRGERKQEAGNRILSPAFCFLLPASCFLPPSSLPREI